jgi:hypothetical protein
MNITTWIVSENFDCFPRSIIIPFDAIRAVQFVLFLSQFQY